MRTSDLFPKVVLNLEDKLKQEEKKEAHQDKDKLEKALPTLNDILTQENKTEENENLEISFEEEDSILLLKDHDEKKHQDQKLQSSYIKEILKNEDRMQEEVEILTELILEELLKKESQNFLPKRRQFDFNMQEEQNHKYEGALLHNQGKDKFIQEKQPLIKIQPIIENQIETETAQNLTIKNPMGIDTSEKLIEDYMNEIFCQIKSRGSQFMQAFATPIYRNPLEILNNIQKPEHSFEIENQLDLTNSLSCILNVQLYLTLEKARENIIHETLNQIKKQNLLLSSSGQNQYSEEDLVDLISESQHIHNKVVFDCINEALNVVRPYGITGEPMPWSNKPRKNLESLMNDTQALNPVLDKVKNKVMGWATTKAGALPHKMIERFQEGAMDEDKFAQQREKCLAQLLAQDIVESEAKWLDYEMEEAQVKIDLSDIILEHLVGECCDVLNGIQYKRQSFK